MYPLNPVHALEKGFVDDEEEEAWAAGWESSWTELAHLKPESWDRKDCCAAADIGWRVGDIAWTALTLEIAMTWTAVL